MNFLRIRTMLPTRISAFSEGYYINNYAWLNDMGWANKEIILNNI